MTYPGTLGRVAQYFSAGFSFDYGRYKVRHQVASACTECTGCTAAEMLGILTKQPVIAMSQLYAIKQGMLWGLGGGVCAEELWPDWFTYGPETWTSGVSDYNQTNLAMATAPSAAAAANALNQKITDYAYFSSDGTPAGIKAACIAALRSGYVLGCLYPPDHAVVALDYVDNGVAGQLTLVGFNNNDTPYELGIDFLTPQIIYKAAKFTGVTPPPLVIPSWVYPPPTPKGNPMITGSVSLVGGNNPTGIITANYPGDANNNPATVYFNPDGTPYTPPANPTIPPLSSITDSTGGVWTLGTSMQQYGYPVLLNGSNAAGGQAILINYTNSQIKVQNNKGDWWLWQNNNWKNTTAP